MVADQIRSFLTDRDDRRIRIAGRGAREVLVHLPADPEPGQLIELPDGMRGVVDVVKPSSRAGIDADVVAIRSS